MLFFCGSDVCGSDVQKVVESLPCSYGPTHPQGYVIDDGYNVCVVISPFAALMVTETLHFMHVVMYVDILHHIHEDTSTNRTKF